MDDEIKEDKPSPGAVVADNEASSTDSGIQINTGEMPSSQNEEIVRLKGPLDFPPVWDNSKAVQVFLLLGFLATAYFMSSWPGKELLTASRQTVWEHREYYRLITAIFVHRDYVHFFANAPMIFFFGYWLRHYYGKQAFPIGALLCGIAAHAATIWYYEPQVSLIGASGVAYAMVALWLVYYMAFATGFSLKYRFMRAIGVALILMFPTSFDQHTSYLAHLLGFICGILYGLGTLKSMKKKYSHFTTTSF